NGATVLRLVRPRPGPRAFVELVLDHAACRVASPAHVGKHIEDRGTKLEPDCRSADPARPQSTRLRAAPPRRRTRQAHGPRTLRRATTQPAAGRRPGDGSSLGQLPYARHVDAQPGS